MVLKKTSDLDGKKNYLWFTSQRQSLSYYLKNTKSCFPTLPIPPLTLLRLCSVYTMFPLVLFPCSIPFVLCNATQYKEHKPYKKKPLHNSIYFLSQIYIFYFAFARNQPLFLWFDNLYFVSCLRRSIFIPHSGLDPESPPSIYIVKHRKTGVQRLFLQEIADQVRDEGEKWVKANINVGYQFW